MYNRFLNGLSVIGSREQVHQISARFAIGLIFERDVEIWRMTEHVEKRPERKPLRAIGLKPEIYPQPIYAAFLYSRRSI